jgi:membrane protease YdiL (CAAX protease family)
MAKLPVTVTRDSQALREPFVSTPGLRGVAAYAAVAAALEVASGLGDSMVAVIGYAVLIVFVANHVGAALLSSSTHAARAAAPSAMLVVPLSLRFVALTLEPGPVSAARQFALVGAPAVTALVCAAVGFPELRPRLDLLVRQRRQRLIALSGLPIGLVCAVIFDRNSLVPQHGTWRSPLALLVLLAAAAVTEEVLFRGFLQAALQRLVGDLAPFAGTAALALVYVGVRPLGFASVAVLLGLCSAVVVELSGRLEGVVVAHVLLYAGLFVIWPWLLGLHS